MGCANRFRREDAARFVGDPVDVITGAITDSTFDFRLEAPFPFEFVRHYSSANHAENRGLGWGHRHDFDHELRFTYNNTVGYVAADGRRISFPMLGADGTRVARYGYQLERVQSNWYRVHLPDEEQGILEFELWRPDWPARLAAISHEKGTTRLFYDGTTGLLTSVVDALGRTTRIDWVTIPDPRTGRPRPHIAQFTLLPSPASPTEEFLLSYHYDAHGHLLGGTDRYRNTFSFAYDQHSRMTKLVDRRGYSFYYSYDSNGRCVHSTAEDGVEEVKLEYLQGATIVTLADGGHWVYEHHDGYLSRIIDPYGGEHRRELDDDGQLCAEIDEAGRQFEIVRDDTGKAVGRRDSTGHVWPMGQSPREPEHYVASNAREWEYGTLLPEDHGLPIRRYLEVDRLPAFVIDALTPPATGTMSVDFADRWNETEVKDLQGVSLRTERHDNTRRSWSYDVSANRTRFTDFDGSTWRWSITSWNRPHQIINPVGATTEVVHSRRLLPLRIVDAGGLTTDYGYDLKNRLAGVMRDGVVHETYRYDERDELAEKFDGRGKNLLRYERANDGRQVTLRLASGERHQLVYTHARRLAGAVVEAADGTRDTYGFEYDISGRTTREDRNGEGVRRRFVEGELDEIRVLNKFGTKYVRGHRNTVYVIDPTGAKHAVQTCHGGVVRRRMSNGITEVAQYHPKGYCLAKIAFTSNGHRWSRLYERSGEGDVRAIHDSARGTHHFAYDAAHRLVGETAPNGQTNTFKYTQSSTLVEAPGLSRATLARQRLLEANGSRFEYDHRDSLSARHTPSGTFRLTHDSLDQLTHVDGPSFAWSARYDVLGRRTETTFNGAKTTFYWDGDRLAAEVLPDKRLRVYVYVDELALIPLMFVDYASTAADPSSGVRYFVFSNHLGAPEVVQNDAGEVVWRGRYAAYGTVHVEVGHDFHQPLRWPGHYFDVATGLHYVRFRYYSPELGQFLESDPQGIRGGFNLYGYGSGNPLRNVDVRGLADQPCPATPPAEPEKKGKPVTQDSHLPDSPDAPAKKRPAFPNLKRGGGKTDAHADRVARAMAEVQPAIKRKRSVTVIEHADGSVSFGMSGKDPERASQAKQVERHLNEQEKGKPPEQRTKFRAASNDVDASRLKDGPDDAPKKGQCSEPAAAQAAGESNSPPESYQTIWAGPEKSFPEAHKRDEPSTPGGYKKMEPCGTCQCNGGEYTTISSAGGAK
ncbi:DUF6531 domain-containing protein [Pendulispora rubella]|uniref:DUF6531 domain-containing protein n=1 Tax=Pendulispora rubella TaxID=2741070 RepID=A0ABZ2KVA3_9BACT